MPSAWDNGLRVSIKNTVDLSKIQKTVQKAQCEILIGFPSGRRHVPTIHKNAEGKYAGYNGESVEDIKPVETAELAKELHYGTATIPARPFLEDGIESKKGELKKALEEEAKKAVNGGQANWDKVGTMAVGAVQEFVRGEYYRSNVPNSQKTKDYKGSDKPLIDGGDLINSLVYVKEGRIAEAGTGNADSAEKEA